MVAGLSELNSGIGLEPAIGDDGKPAGVYKFGLLGSKGFFLHGTNPSVVMLFHLMIGFMITAAIIPIGAMAERWRWKSFLLYGLWIALPYSIYANWMWGGGWLAQAGLNWGLGHGAVDFAGSGVVYGLAGVIALAGCMILGPRRGGVAGSDRALSGRRLAAVVAGTAILVVPTFVMCLGAEIAPVGVNTVFSILAGAVGAVLMQMLRRAPVEVATICNGLLSGLAAISAPCAFVDSIGATIIGGLAGMLCVLSRSFWARSVDDVTGAVSTFGISGIWGLVALGLFASGKWGEGWSGVIRPGFVEKYGSDGVRGLFYGDPGQLAAQLLGAGVLVVFGFAMALAWFKLSNLLVPMRISRESELKDLGPAEGGVADRFPVPREATETTRREQSLFAARRNASLANHAACERSVARSIKSDCNLQPIASCKNAICNSSVASRVFQTSPICKSPPVSPFNQCFRVGGHVKCLQAGRCILQRRFERSPHTSCFASGKLRLIKSELSCKAVFESPRLSGSGTTAGSARRGRWVACDFEQATGQAAFVVGEAGEVLSFLVSRPFAPSDRLWRPRGFAPRDGRWYFARPIHLRAGVSAPVVQIAKVLLHERSKSYVHDPEKVWSVVFWGDRVYGDRRLECDSAGRAGR